MISRVELIWLLNRLDRWTNADAMVELLGRGDIEFDDQRNLRTTKQGAAKLRGLDPTTTKSIAASK